MESNAKWQVYLLPCPHPHAEPIHGHLLSCSRTRRRREARLLPDGFDGCRRPSNCSPFPVRIPGVERAGGQRRSSRTSSSSSRARLEVRAHYHCYLDFSGETRRPRGTAGRCGGCHRGWHTSLTLLEGGLCTLLRDMLMHDSTRTRSCSSFSARSSSHSARRPTRPLGCSRGWSQGS